MDVGTVVHGSHFLSDRKVAKYQDGAGRSCYLLPLLNPALAGFFLCNQKYSLVIFLLSAKEVLFSCVHKS